MGHQTRPLPPSAENLHGSSRSLSGGRLPSVPAVRCVPRGVTLEYLPAVAAVPWTVQSSRYLLLVAFPTPCGRSCWYLASHIPRPPHAETKSHKGVGEGKFRARRTQWYFLTGLILSALGKWAGCATPLCTTPTRPLHDEQRNKFSQNPNIFGPKVVPSGDAMAATLAEPRRGGQVHTQAPQVAHSPLPAREVPRIRCQRTVVERMFNLAAGTGCAATLVLVHCTPFCDFISFSRLTGRGWRSLSLHPRLFRFVLVLLISGSRDGSCVAGSNVPSRITGRVRTLSNIPQIVPGREPAKVHAPNPNRKNSRGRANWTPRPATSEALPALTDRYLHPAWNFLTPIPVPSRLNS